jgi:ribosomal protein L21
VKLTETPSLSIIIGSPEPGLAVSSAFLFRPVRTVAVRAAGDGQFFWQFFWSLTHVRGHKNRRQAVQSFAAGDKIKVEQIPADIGTDIQIDQVLAVGSGAEIQVGAPLVSGAAVSATVLSQGRGDKKVTHLQDASPQALPEGIRGIVRTTPSCS